MKPSLQIVPIVTFVSCIMFTACVSKKKYHHSQDWAGRLQKDSTLTHKELDNCNINVKNLTSQRDLYQSENQASQNDLKNLASKSKLTIADQAKRLKDLQYMSSILSGSLIFTIQI